VIILKISPSKRIKYYEHPEAERSVKFAAKLEKEGKRVIRVLWSGDPVKYGEFQPSKRVARALVDAAKEGWFMYPTYGVELELRQAIADREKEFHGISYSPDKIIVTSSVTKAIDLLYFSLMDEKDELITPEPVYFTYISLSKCYPFRRIISKRDEENEWLYDLDDLRAKISEKTKGIVIANPDNPTGAVYNEKVLREIVDIAGEHDSVLISDEIYNLTTFDGARSVSIVSVARDVPCIVLNGMTKSLFVPGWRVGYMCYHDPEGKMDELIKRTRCYNDTLMLMPTPILVAALTAYKKQVIDKNFRTALKEIQKRRDYCLNRLHMINGMECVEPKGGYFAFPRINGIGKIWKNDWDFVLNLLEEEGVMVRPGIMFGEKYGVGHCRISFLSPIDKMKEALDKIELFMEKHTA